MVLFAATVVMACFSHIPDEPMWDDIYAGVVDLMAILHGMLATKLLIHMRKGYSSEDQDVDSLGPKHTIRFAVDPSRNLNGDSENPVSR